MSALQLHFRSPSHWRGPVRIHFWDCVPPRPGTQWPGEDMISEGGGWFAFEIASAETASIVFNDGAGHQTPDLRRDGSGSYFADGRWHARRPAASASRRSARASSGRVSMPIPPEGISIGVRYNPRQVYRVIGRDLCSARMAVPLNDQTYRVVKAAAVPESGADALWDIVVREGEIWLSRETGRS